MKASKLSLIVFALVALSGGGQGASATATAEVALPSEVDLRPQFRQWGLLPRDQGPRPTCSVFVTASALEFALARRDGRGVRLSIEYLNWAGNQATGNPRGDGHFFHNVLAGLEKHGACPEEDWSYQRRHDPDAVPSATATLHARKLLESKHEVHWISPWKRQLGVSEDDFLRVKAVLAQGYPVAAGSEHSRLIVGYRDDPKRPGGGMFTTKDSAGGSFDFISYQFFRENCNDLYWLEATGGKDEEREPPAGA